LQTSISTQQINLIRVFAWCSATDVHAPRLWLNDDGEHSFPDAGSDVVASMPANGPWIPLVVEQQFLDLHQVWAPVRQVEQLVDSPLPVM
jgi:hypothetical protein